MHTISALCPVGVAKHPWDEVLCPLELHVFFFCYPNTTHSNNKNNFILTIVTKTFKKIIPLKLTHKHTYAHNITMYVCLCVVCVHVVYVLGVYARVVCVYVHVIYVCVICVRVMCVWHVRV